MTSQSYQNHILLFIFANHFTITFILDIIHDTPDFYGQILNNKIQQFLYYYCFIYFMVYFSKIYFFQFQIPLQNFNLVFIIKYFINFNYLMQMQIIHIAYFCYVKNLYHLINADSKVFCN